MNKKPHVKLCRQGRAHLGELRLPTKAGNITVSMLGWDPVSALRRASAAALTIAQDPRLAPFLPPQAIAAAQTVHMLTQMSTEGLKEAKATGTPATAKVADKLIDARRQYTGDVGAQVRDNRKGATQNNKVTRGRQKGKTYSRWLAMQREKDHPRTRAQTEATATRADGTPLVRPGASTYPGGAHPGGAEYADPTDQYGQMPPGYPPQPGQYPPGWYPNPGGGDPLTPADYMAMHAWGEDAFGQEDGFDREEAPDDYFGEYEAEWEPGPWSEPDAESEALMPEELPDEADASQAEG
jgi:hypothetical protein